ncbi:SDR family oxidoreductase [Rossellomorea vietnamensis]|uniref:SDR family oxidoreductase n=1 Tax=Rossellomorea vietnamensis TaxID=218284 RepID=A0A5D4NPM3_9BACI|nr:SDR family oxidoreductase [Rossellomorea vietnamensis]TYS15839.1 SDR family oxidoreductase [Rossellomorea vietnamensis]
MEKAIVTGAMGFLGFELCLAMLEEGLEVLAADSANAAGDRWLEVGRNSNITYQHLDQEVPEEAAKASVFINLYDYFTERKRSKTLKDISSFIEKNKKSFKEAAVLLPTVLSNRSGETELSDFLQFLEEQDITNQYSIYLPTLFGSGQPETFLFQQLLSKSDKEDDFVDDPRSAIYVKDAAQAVLHNGRSLESILLLSDDHDSWKKSLSLLEQAGPDRGEVQNYIDIIPQKLKHVGVKASLSFEEVLELQRKP